MTAFFRTAPLRRLTKPLAALALAGLFAGPALAREQTAPAPAAPVAGPVAAPAPAPQVVHPALWKVADADTTIYLFGTVHVLKPGYDWLNGPLKQALDGSDELVTEVLDPVGGEAQAALLSRATLPAGQTLRALMDAPQRTAFEALLGRVGLQAPAFDRFKPWYAAVVLSSLPMISQGLSPKDGAEATLNAYPGGKARTRAGLETIDYQLGLFDTLPADAQLAYLGNVVRDYDKIGPEIDSLIVAWGKGDAEALATIMNADMDDPRLTETLLVGRNRHWAQWIKARLDKPGTVFVAVGAGHLAGKGSVQEQLAALGLATQRVQ